MTNCIIYSAQGANHKVPSAIHEAFRNSDIGNVFGVFRKNTNNFSAKIKKDFHGLPRLIESMTDSTQFFKFVAV